MAETTSRQNLEVLRAQLENERSTFLTHWRDLADHILPRRPRFYTSDINKGDRRNSKIMDSTATLAARTLRSGMMSGVTSPARPWFRLTTPDPQLSEQANVKEWLYQVSERMATVFLRSNLYNVLPITYGDMGVFGTAAMGIEEDFENSVRFYSFPVGSYCISVNPQGKVDTFFRDFKMTVRQLVERFGEDEETGEINWDIFSPAVKSAWDSGHKEMWFEICHLVQPNEGYDESKLHSKYKKFKSCYYERGLSPGGQYLDAKYEKVLSEKGYDFFPVLCPRWEVTGEDSYGTTCPGMDALGDIRQLQVGEKRILQAIEKIVNPPMVAPTTMRNQKTSILPGDLTYVDVRDGQQGFRPAHEVQIRINELEQKQGQCRQRIQRAFYEDLFLMLANSDRRQITAREIEERHEEKLLALGPVLEQLNQDLLDPLIDNTFDILMRQNQLPPPPEELHGMNLRVDYLSVMAQAQKLAGIQSVDRFVGFVSQLVPIMPEASDKIDVDKLIDTYSDMTSVPPEVVRSQEEVDAKRQERSKAVASQQAAEQASQMTGAVKNLGQTPMGDGSNALNELLSRSQAGSVQ